MNLVSVFVSLALTLHVFLSWEDRGDLHCTILHKICPDLHAVAYGSVVELFQTAFICISF